MYVYLQIFIRFLNVVFQLDSCILGPIVIVFSYSSFKPSLLNVSRVCYHCPFTITYNIRFITILWKLILTLQYTIHTHQTHTTCYSNSPLFPPPSFYSLLLPSTPASLLLLPPPSFYSLLQPSTPASFLLLPNPQWFALTYTIPIWRILSYQKLLGVRKGCVLSVVSSLNLPSTPSSFLLLPPPSFYSLLLPFTPPPSSPLFFNKQKENNKR